MYTFSDDDSVLSKRLLEAIEKEDVNLKSLAKNGLSTSRDEVFRSVCIEYLDGLGLIDEEDIIIGLSDDEDIVIIEAITASENVNSKSINDKLIELAKISNDEFIVSWSIVTVGMKTNKLSQKTDFFLKQWSESELVHCSVAFYSALNQASNKDTLRFFNFLKSENYLVRGMVLNLSDLFVDFDISEKIEKLLVEHQLKESVMSLKELLNMKLSSFSKSSN